MVDWDALLRRCPESELGRPSLSLRATRILPILIPLQHALSAFSIASPLRMRATPQIFLLKVTPLYRSPFGVVTISFLNGRCPSACSTTSRMSRSE